MRVKTVVDSWTTMGLHASMAVSMTSVLGRGGQPSGKRHALYRRLCRLHPDVVPFAAPGRSPGWGLDGPTQANDWVFDPVDVWSADAAAAHVLDRTSIAVKVRTPGPQVLYVEDGSVLTATDVVLNQSGAVRTHLLEGGDWPSRLPADLAVPWRPGDARSRLERAVSLLDGGDSHFGHGMFDLLPRLMTVRDSRIEGPLLVSARMPSNVRWWLRVLLPDVPVVAVRRGRVISAGELVVPLPRASLHQPGGLVDDGGVRDARVDPVAVIEMQRLAGNPLRRGERRVWFRRDHAPGNRLDSEARLTGVAGALGFESVYPERMSVEQIQLLLAQTSHVIVPRGSAAANLILSAPGQRVLVITGPLEAGDIATSAAWIQALGHHVRYLCGRSSPTGGHEVRPDDLRTCLEAWMESS